MRTNLKIHEMSDLQYRNYKIRRRKKMEFKNRITALAFAFSLILILLFVFRTVHSSADNTTIKYKYFTVVSIKAGESLWDLADEYMDLSVYEGKNDYIDEVVRINNLKDPSSVRNGQKITIPYYSTEYKN